MNDSVKRTFGPNLRIGIVFQILDNLRHACGMQHDSASTVKPKAHVKIVPIHKWLIGPISALYENFFPGKINPMPAANPEIKLGESLDRDPMSLFLDGHKIASRKKVMFIPGQMKGLVLLAGLLVFGCSQEPPVEKVVSALQTPAPIYDGTIVAVGDSLTAGLGVPEDQAYPAQLARRLQADGYDYRVVNAGISGETSSGALSRIRWVVSSLKPDIVILETGANDGLRGVDPNLLETNLDQLVGTLVDQNILVILAGMRMLPNLGPAYSRAFDDIYPRIAAKHEVDFIPFFLQDVAGRPDLNQDDRLHPNADGYAQIVNTVYPYVITAIGRLRAG